MDMRALFLLTVAVGFQFGALVAWSSEPLQSSEAERSKPNVKTRTLGGTQFWTDELFFHHWRIQRNAFTNHRRLLDSENRRQAWGSFEACLAKLDQIKRERRLPVMEGKAVIVLHGLGRSRSSMNRLSDYLRDQGGYQVFAMGYASTRAEVGDFADALDSIVTHLEGIEEINFVAHSLGNLVIRRYLADHADPTTGRPTDTRIRRFVMLAPPNNGSKIAESWRDSELFRGVMGPAGQQLARGWSELGESLAVPSIEFGILAGGRGDGEGWSAKLPGDDDGTVGVETTKLHGARDFSVIRVRHTFIMNDPTVLEYALRFLQEGHFVAEARRQPIVLKVAKDAVQRAAE